MPAAAGVTPRPQAARAALSGGARPASQGLRAQAASVGAAGSPHGMRPSQRRLSRAQVRAGAPQEDAERRERLLPAALAAVEAALRRAPDALGVAAKQDAGVSAGKARSRRHLVPVAELR